MADQVKSYRVELEDGRAFDVPSPSGQPPTEAEIAQYMAQHPPEPTMRSVAEGITPMGSAKNIATSFGNLLMTPFQLARAAGGAGWEALKYSATNDPQQKAKIAEDMAKQLVHLPGEVWGALKERYGSVPRVMQTLYEDPFGFAGDLAMIAEGGEGLALKAGAPRAARMFGKVAAIDPVKQGLKLGSAVLDKGADFAIKATVRPTRHLAESFQTTVPEIVDRLKKSNITNAVDAREAAEAAAEADDAFAVGLRQGGHTGAPSKPYVEGLDTGRLRTKAETRKGPVADFGKAEAQLNKKVNDLTERYKTQAARPATPDIDIPATPDTEIPARFTEAPVTEADIADAQRVTAERLADERRIAAQRAAREENQARVGPQANLAPPHLFGPVDEPLGVRAANPVAGERVGQLGTQAQFVPPRMLASPGVRTEAVRIPGMPAQHIPGQPALPELWANIPPDELLRGRREAQRIAYNKGVKSKDFPAQLAGEQARLLKKLTEDYVPEMAERAQDTQKLMSIEHAFDAAEANRPNRFGQALGSMVLGTIPAAAGIATGHGVAGALAGTGIGTGAMMALQAIEDPARGAAAAQKMYRGSQKLMSPRVLQAVRAMRAAGATEGEINGYLMNEALK